MFIHINYQHFLTVRFFGPALLETGTREMHVGLFLPFSDPN